MSKNALYNFFSSTVAILLDKKLWNDLIFFLVRDLIHSSLICFLSSLPFKCIDIVYDFSLYIFFRQPNEEWYFTLSATLFSPNHSFFFEIYFFMSYLCPPLKLRTERWINTMQLLFSIHLGKTFCSSSFSLIYLFFAHLFLVFTPI